MNYKYEIHEIYSFEKYGYNKWYKMARTSELMEACCAHPKHTATKLVKTTNKW